MPIWTRIQEGEVDHWADLPAAQAWARNALAVASEDTERRLSGSGADREEQGLVLERAIDALSAAYRCANVSPTTEPTWLATLRAAYGAGFATGFVTSDGGDGWIVRQSRDVFRVVTGQTGTSFKTYARLWLSPNGQPLSAGFEGDSVAGTFDPSLGWTGRAQPSGAACADPFGDWDCVAWATPPGDPNVLLLPAAVWSLALVRLAAQPLAASPRSWLFAALRGGAAPIVDSGDAAPPDDPSLDIASAERPAPPRTPPPPPVVIVTPPGTPTPTPAPVTRGEAATLLPILLGAGLIGLVLLGQNTRGSRRR